MGFGVAAFDYRPTMPRDGALILSDLEEAFSYAVYDL